MALHRSTIKPACNYDEHTACLSMA